ncbi:MAG TPA: alpha-hydroxy acid oxidase [Acidimicrobiia bacterium]|jgi:L-lactate dehydrogenase (cytochrome)
MERRLPRWSELRQLIRIEPPAFRREERLERAATIWDLRRMGRRRTPRAVFDYVDGAAEAEISLRRSRNAFRRVEFVPSVLRDVSKVDTSATILGKPASLPLALSPTGFTRMMHAAGEPAVAAAAAAAGVPYSLSTLGTTSARDLSRQVPQGERWFQLYVWKDRGFARELIDAARDGRYSALILTVDTPVAGARLRDVYNGLTIPPKLRWKTLIDGALHPAWWWDFLTTEPLEFASLRSSEGTVADLIDKVFDPTVDFDDLAWLKETWNGPVIVKGIQTPEDAVAVTERGADAVIVSNHGGRQLDRAPVTLEVLPEVVAAVGDRAEVYVDGGVMSGADIAAAVCFGAKAAMVGRAYLYGLMAGGRAGVDRALAILSAELVRTMQLLGVTSVEELDRSRVRLRDH